jgi:hypothetical protein
VDTGEPAAELEDNRDFAKMASIRDIGDAKWAPEALADRRAA